MGVPARGGHPGRAGDHEAARRRGHMSLLEDGAWHGKVWTGSWTDGSGGTYTAVEPATGAELGEVGRATPADVEKAGLRAPRARGEWAALPFEQRAAVLRRAGDLLTEHAEEVKDWLARESGAI